MYNNLIERLQICNKKQYMKELINKTEKFVRNLRRRL